MSEHFEPIVWVDEPPPATGRQREYAWFAQQLRDNPGKWGILPGKRRGGYSTSINEGKFAAFRPAGAFEAVTRRPLESNEPTTYVRYVGLNPDPPTENGTVSIKRSQTREDSLRQLGARP